MDAFQREGDILLRRQVGVEIKLLKDEADPAAQLAQGAAGKLARRFTVDQNLAAAEGFQLVDQADQGGFARSRRAEDRHHFAGFNL